MRDRSGAWLSLVLCACAARQPTQEPGPPPNNNAVAMTLGVIAGCKLQNNCGYGAYCNHDTGFCVVRKCSEGCPGNAVCNEGLDRCQDPPPPRTPSDQLPQDSKINNLPGSH
jgi:hypothetical protein